MLVILFTFDTQHLTCLSQFCDFDLCDACCQPETVADPPLLKKMPSPRLLLAIASPSRSALVVPPTSDELVNVSSDESRPPPKIHPFYHACSSAARGNSRDAISCSRKTTGPTAISYSSSNRSPQTEGVNTGATTAGSSYCFSPPTSTLSHEGSNARLQVSFAVPRFGWPDDFNTSTSWISKFSAEAVVCRFSPLAHSSC